MKGEKRKAGIEAGLLKIFRKTPFLSIAIKNINSINRVVSSLFIEFWYKMSFSETSHLIGFSFGTIFVFVKFTNDDCLFGLQMMRVYVGMNVKSSLLSLENKRRIHRLIER